MSAGRRNCQREGQEPAHAVAETAATGPPGKRDGGGEGVAQRTGDVIAQA